MREEQPCTNGITLFALTIGSLPILHVVVVLEVRKCCQFSKIPHSRNAVIMA